MFLFLFFGGVMPKKRNTKESCKKSKRGWAPSKQLRRKMTLAVKGNQSSIDQISKMYELGSDNTKRDLYRLWVACGGTGRGKASRIDYKTVGSWPIKN